MKEYVLSILAAALTAAVIDKLTPSGEGGRTSASVRFLTGLCLVITLISPLRQGVEYLTDLAEGTLPLDDLIPTYEADYGAVFGETLLSVSREEGEAWVKDTLQNTFGIPPDGGIVWVGCVAEGTTVTFSEVRISLRGGYALTDPHPIEVYIQAALGCPCYVTVTAS